MAGISTHVLDTAQGHPATGIVVSLHRREDHGWVPLSTGTTDDDGRVGDLLGDETLTSGIYRVVFDIAGYHGAEAFYPEAAIVFRVDRPDEHHHIPLLLSPFGYTTYRGS